MRNHLDPTCARFGTEAALQFLFGGREESANGDHAAKGSLNRFGDFRLLCLRRPPSRKAYREEEGRTEECEIAARTPPQRRIKNRMMKTGVAYEPIGMFRLPERPSWVVTNVLANGGELSGGEGKYEPKV